MEEHAVLNVVIDNFKRIKKCPFCGIKPNMMKWSDGKIEMWCRNLQCMDGFETVEITYGPEDLNLVELTEKLIKKWNDHCREAEKKMMPV